MLNRDDLINHILAMKQQDESYARWALKQYNAMLPHFDLMSGVREALEAQGTPNE